MSPSARIFVADVKPPASVTQLPVTPFLASSTEPLRITMAGSAGCDSHPNIHDPRFHPLFSTVVPLSGSVTIPLPWFSPTKVTVALPTAETTATWPGSPPPLDFQIIRSPGTGSEPVPLPVQVKPRRWPGALIESAAPFQPALVQAAQFPVAHSASATRTASSVHWYCSPHWFVPSAVTQSPAQALGLRPDR